MPAARYWRAVGLQSVGGGALELSALHLYGGAARLDAGAAIASTIAPASGALAALQDDDLASTCRFAGAAVRSGGFAIVWNFGAGNTADVTDLRIAGPLRDAFLARGTLQYSTDGSLWQWQADVGSYDWPGAGAYHDTASAGGDPYYNSVSLLLHMDGADGSTTFTDSSAAPKAVTPFGAAKISTAQSRFGGASGHFGGAGSYVTSPGSGAFAFGAGDFTVELWIKTTTLSENVLIDQYSSAATWQLAVRNGKLSWYSSGYVLTGAIVVSDGDWHHVAATRASGVLRFFADGVLCGSVALATDYNRADIPLGVGAQAFSRNSSYDFSGYMDDVRITKGVARYIANFTPPTEMFAGIAGVLPRAPAPDRARIAAASPVPPHSALSAPPLLLARDMEFGGPGRIWGATKIETSPGSRVPTKARVSILRGRDKLLAREVWSDPVTGEWEVNGLDTRQDFVVLAQDSAGNYQPVAADKTMPEAP